MIWDKYAVEEGLKEVSACRESMLARLKLLLDSYHNESKPSEYYDLVASDWLEIFTHKVYVTIKEVESGNAGQEFPIPVAPDFSSSKANFRDVKCHDQMRWLVKTLLQGIKSVKWEFARHISKISSGGNKAWVFRLLNLFSTPKPKLLITYPYFKCSKLTWLNAMWQWRKWARWDDLHYPVTVESNIDVQWRNSQAASLLPALNFPEIAHALLPLFLPAVLLEGFVEFRKKTLSFNIPRPTAAYSANAMHNHLVWKLLVAEWRLKGTLLLYHQHGGGYGIDLKHFPEEFETRISDIFYTFGWKPDCPNIKPLSPPAFNLPEKKRTKIVLMCFDAPKVVAYLQFFPQPGTIEKSLEATREFLSTFPKDKSLFIRAYPEDMGWGFAKMMKELSPEAEFDDFQKNLATRFAESRLVIHNYFCTGFLETMSLNIPTVCFFEPEAYAFRYEAQQFIGRLKATGILHCSGQGAAEFVASLDNKFEDWWARKEIQELRKQFVEKFANYSLDWKSQWEREFKTICKVSR